MRLRINDPGRVGLHRAIRAAIGTTVSLLIALTLLPGTPAGVLAAFGSIALLGTADFGGSARRRTISITATGAAGALLIVVGGLASLSVWSVVIVTFVVTGSLAFLVALRGTFASACPALTTVYVASAMVATTVDSIGSLVAGWAIAVAVALPVTLLVLPRRDLAPVRAACISVLHTLAETVRQRGEGRPLDQKPIEAARATLRDSYLGNPFRAAGLSPSDRALIVLVGQLEGLLTALSRGYSYSDPLSRLPVTGALITASAASFDAQAQALGSPDAPPPMASTVTDLWLEHWEAAVTAMGEASYGDPAQRVGVIDSAFTDRAMAISAVRICILVRRVLHLPAEKFDESEHTIPEPPMARPWRELANQLTMRSPWLRMALRTGVALALATLVVEVIGIAHGFWVVLGVVATLRMDGVATLKTSLLAVLGTFAGALIGFGVLATEGNHRGLMWIGFVIVAFLAVYTQATTAYVIGQAAFSLFVIVAFSLVNWPPKLSTVDERFIDVLIGAGISAVVALLMWPRGVAAGLTGNVSDAITRATRLLSDAIADLVNGPGRVSPQELTEVSSAFVRSKEVVEVSLSSKSPDAIAKAHAWEAVIDNLRTLTMAGHLMANWSTDRPAIASVIPALAQPLENDCDSVVAEWTRTACEVEGQTPGPNAPEPDFIHEVSVIAPSVDLGERAVADRMVGAIWAHGWLRMCHHAATSAEVPVRSR